MDCRKTLSIGEKAEDIFKVDGSKLMGLTEDAADRYKVLYIPDEIGGVKITEIGNNAFRKSTCLVKVVLPQGVTTIGEQAFSSCEKLTYLGIHKNLTTIKPWAFFDSKKLTHMIFYGTQTEWDNVQKGTYWNSSVPSDTVVCTGSGLSMLSEIKVNGAEVWGTDTANDNYVYDKILQTFTQQGAEQTKGFYPLRATEDYIVRVQMGAPSGESDFIIHASEDKYITFRTGVDGHSNQVLFVQTNGVWNTETRVGYDLSTFINLDGNGGMLDFVVVRYQGGFYLYVSDYVNPETGGAEKHNHWKLIFSCMPEGYDEGSRFAVPTQDAWGKRYENGTVNGGLITGIQDVFESFENAFAVRNTLSQGGQWKITLDDVDEHAAAFVANPPTANSVFVAAE